jgi:hypothetical protein
MYKKKDKQKEHLHALITMDSNYDRMLFDNIYSRKLIKNYAVVDSDPYPGDDVIYLSPSDCDDLLLHETRVSDKVLSLTGKEVNVDKDSLFIFITFNYYNGIEGRISFESGYLTN